LQLEQGVLRRVQIDGPHLARPAGNQVEDATTARGDAEQALALERSERADLGARVLVARREDDRAARPGHGVDRGALHGRFGADKGGTADDGLHSRATRAALLSVCPGRRAQSSPREPEGQAGAEEPPAARVTRISWVVRLEAARAGDRLV